MTLAMVWSGDQSAAAIWDAKAQGGWKIQGGGNPWNDYLQPKLSATLSAPAPLSGLPFAGCYYDNSGYGYSHAGIAGLLLEYTD